MKSKIMDKIHEPIFSHEANANILEYNLFTDDSFHYTPFDDPSFKGNNGIFSFNFKNGARLIGINNSLKDGNDKCLIKVSSFLEKNNQFMIIYDIQDGHIDFNNNERNIIKVFNKGITYISKDKKVHESYLFERGQNVRFNILIVPLKILETFSGSDINIFINNLMMKSNNKLVSLKFASRKLENIYKINEFKHLESSKFDIQIIINEYLLEICRYLYIANYHNNSISAKNVDEINQSKLSQIKDELVNTLGPLPDLEYYCIKNGYSAKNINYLFKKYYGKSLYSYVTEARLKNAHNMVKFTSLPLKEISYNLGYSHVNHFNFAFSKYFGYPPGALRKNNLLKYNGVE